jgi:Cu(I)/Ag(I) efflux system periplasmic protein CusF
MPFHSCLILDEMTRPSGGISMKSFLCLAILVLPGALVSPAEIRAQGMQPNMKQMPGMGDAKQRTTASATGTVTAVNTADRKITFNHGPIPEIKWPAMKMEFPVLPSVDLSKVKVGDKVRFTLNGSGNAYTVQSIDPAP